MSMFKLAGCMSLSAIAVGMIAATLPLQDDSKPDDFKLPQIGTFSDEKVAALLAKLKASDRIKALMKERLDAAKYILDSRYEEFLNGRGTLDFLHESSARLLKAELEMCNDKADRLAAFGSHLRVLEGIEKANKDRVEAGRFPVKEYKETVYLRADAEIAIERLKAE